MPWSSVQSGSLFQISSFFLQFQEGPVYKCSEPFVIKGLPLNYFLQIFAFTNERNGKLEKEKRRIRLTCIFFQSGKHSKKNWRIEVNEALGTMLSNYFPANCNFLLYSIHHRSMFIIIKLYTLQLKWTWTQFEMDIHFNWVCEVRMQYNRNEYEVLPRASYDSFGLVIYAIGVPGKISCAKWKTMYAFSHLIICLEDC